MHLYTENFLYYFLVQKKNYGLLIDFIHFLVKKNYILISLI